MPTWPSTTVASAPSARSGTAIDGDATTTIDATDLIVAPGFIDIHTHYDAQAFWDTTLSPSPLHGVTTVMGGNCGFTIAPLAAGDGPVDPADADYLMRMLARVEGMPLESLQQGVPWDWTSTEQYLDRLDGTLMPNAGFLVGHSALRRVVMHDDATARESTPSELDEMKRLLRLGIAAGGMGFSSTWSSSHNDHTGVPVPSRHASREELVELCRVVGEFPGTTLEFIPQVGEFTRETFELMSDMSAAANRPLNWNLLQVYTQNWDNVQHQLTGGDIAAERGGRVLALTLPDSFRLRINFTSGFVFDILNGWDRLMALPVDEKLRQLARPRDACRVGPARPIDGRLGAGDRQLGRLRAPRDVQPRDEAVRGTHHRRRRDRARQVGVGHDGRCGGGRRPAHGVRQPGPRSGRRDAGSVESRCGATRGPSSVPPTRAPTST